MGKQSTKTSVRSETVTQTITKSGTYNPDNEFKIYTNPRIPIFVPKKTSLNKSSDKDQHSEERRQHARHNLEFSVIIMCGSLSHKTKSIDISPGGIKLQDMIPDSFIGKNLDLYIIDPSHPADSKSKTIALKAKSISSRLCFALKFESMDVVKANRVQSIIDYLTILNKKKSLG